MNSSYIESLINPGARLASKRAESRYNQYPEFSDEDERSIVGSLRDKSIGTLAAAGNVLDLPGSSIRDALAGENPLDQWLPWNWTSPDNRTTGRDLARQWGMARSSDTWGNAIGGFGVEVALDPLTYLTFGGSALGKAGQAAKGAGLLDDVSRVAARKAGVAMGQIGKREGRLTTTLDDMLRYGTKEGQEKARDLIGKGFKPLEQFGGTIGIGLPFMDPIGTIGKGKAYQSLARGLDKVGSAVRYAEVPGTGIAPLDSLARAFSARDGDAKSKFGREVFRSLFRSKEKVNAVARGKAINLANRLQKAGVSEEEFGDILTTMVEDVGPTGKSQLDPRVAGSYNAAVAKASAIPGAMNEITNIAGELRTELDDLLRISKDMGLNTKDINDLAVDYMPRFLAKALGYKPRRDGRMMPTFDPSQTGRLDMFRDAPGGTTAVREMVRDPKIREIKEQITAGTATTDTLENYLKQEHGHWLSDAYRIYDPEKRKFKAANQGRFKAIAQKLHALSPDDLELGIFGNHPIVDVEARLLAGYNAVESADHLLDALSQPGILQAPGQSIDDLVKLGGEAGERVSVEKVIKDAGLRWSSKKQNGFADLLSKKLGVTNDALKDFTVARKHSEDLGRMMKLGTAQEPVQEWLKIMDGVVNFSKGMWTTVWPAFHMRNLMSGQAHNFLRGITDIDSLRSAHEFSAGKAVHNAIDVVINNPELRKQAAAQGFNVGQGGAKLTKEEATRVLQESVYAHSVVGKFNSNATGVVGHTNAMQSGTLNDMLSGTARLGQPSMRIGRVARKAIGIEPGTTLNPMQGTVRGGLTGANESTLGPLAAGEEFGHYIESLNRVAPYIYLLKKGYDPAEAARIVGEAQVQYSNRYYSPFEQQVMKRLLPFYSFTKGITGQVARELTERPGGRLGAVVKAQENMQSGGEMAPDYVRDTASIPVAGNSILESILGAPPEGTDRYITGFGMMHEDPLSFGPNAKGAALELASRMNPFIKAPLELMTGQSFFQKGPDGGRKLDDMDPLIGRLGANLGMVDPENTKILPTWIEQVVANSPVARGLSTARQLTDERKGPMSKMFNTLTGIRIADISPGAKESIIRELLEIEMKSEGAGAFERVYFRKEDLDRMPEADRQAALRLQALSNLLAKRAKERRKTAEKN